MSHRDYITCRYHVLQKKIYIYIYIYISSPVGFFDGFGCDWEPGAQEDFCWSASTSSLEPILLAGSNPHPRAGQDKCATIIGLFLDACRQRGPDYA